VGALSLYFNPVEHTVQQGDPRPNDDENPLPEGWEFKVDDEGDE
jgi:hypothetical protein